MEPSDLAAACAAIAAPACAVDLEGRVVAGNAAFVAASGCAALPVGASCDALFAARGAPADLVVLRSHEDHRQLADLSQRVRDRTQALARLNDVLSAEIAERRRAVDSLQESQSRLELALDHGLLGLWDWHIDRGDLSFDRNCLALIGLGQDPSLPGSEALWEHVHPDDRALFEPALERTLGVDDALLELQLRARHKKGHWATLQVRGRVVMRDGNGVAHRLLGSLTDITERRRLEEQLQHSQKMEGLGRLAGGVAHDFNNLLTAIIGNVEVLEDVVVGNPTSQKDLAEIRRAAMRAAELTQQLLAFARRQIRAPKVINLNDLVLQTDRMLRRLLGEDIELSFLPANVPFSIKADPSQLEQALMNLVVNARDAMPHGGNLVLETRNVTLDDDAAAPIGASRGDYALLSVGDNGVGMSRDVLARIFEPFFTTKPQGRGTGLGLATCYGIVKQSGGHITVDSEPGRGTVFRLYFPRSVENMDAAEAERVPERSLPGRERILVVEDDPGVRRLVERTLGRLGYKVISAANGPEALAIYEREGAAIDLVLTDLVMPQMSGRHLAQTLLARGLDVPILFMSGYAGEQLREEEPEVEFLPKPFTPQILGDRVRHVLDHAATRAA